MLSEARTSPTTRPVPTAAVDKLILDAICVRIFRMSGTHGASYLCYVIHQTHAMLKDLFHSLLQLSSDGRTAPRRVAIEFGPYEHILLLMYFGVIT